MTFKAAVFGAGSWGTTFGAVLADAGCQTTLWARREELATAICEQRENTDYLPGIQLPELLTATHDPEQAIVGAEFVIFAVPSQTLRANMLEWTTIIPRDAVLVSLMKGVEIGSNKRMSEVIGEVADVPEERIAVVTGPNLAREIALRQPTATVVASTNLEVAARLQHVCRTRYFLPYTNHDVIGCELGGAVKNVIALAVGIATGMGFGDNARASLITRGLAEIARLGVAMGAEPLTFAGLAGMGDLVATCASPLSRNRTVGERLGRGESLASIQADMRMVAEGVKSSESVLALAEKHSVEMPITEHVEQVVHEGMSPDQMVSGLMNREVSHELDW